MPQDYNDDTYMDDRLANFVDRLLEDDSPPTLDEGDNELKELEQTTQMLWSTFGSEDPPPRMAERIRENLQLEWQEKQQEQPKIISFSRRYRPLIAAAAAGVVIVIGGLLLTSNTDAQLPGTAVGSGDVLFPVILLIIIAVVFFVYSRSEQ